MEEYLITARSVTQAQRMAQLLERLDGFALRTQRAVTIPLLKTMLETE